MKKINDKHCRSINEVAEMFKVNVWTIRLWVDRFDILQPFRGKTGDLLFNEADVNRIGAICRLAHRKGVKIKNVKQHLESMP